MKFEYIILHNNKLTQKNNEYRYFQKNECNYWKYLLLEWISNLKNSWTMLYKFLPWINIWIKRKCGNLLILYYYSLQLNRLYTSTEYSHNKHLPWEFKMFLREQKSKAAEQHHPPYDRLELTGSRYVHSYLRSPEGQYSLHKCTRAAVAKQVLILRVTDLNRLLAGEVHS